jgi:transketolase
MQQSLRLSYGEALVNLGKTDKKIVVLEADLGKSTLSNLFGNAYPERYFQMGIAEQNMASVAAGLALTGKTAFINSFAVFASGRAYDQIRSSICISNLNVKICGSSAGLSDYGDGKTHQSIDDIAIMRVLPHMKVLSPVDAVETAQMVEAMAKSEGPCYIRINRNDLPIYTDPGQSYHIGRMNQIREGEDVVVFATGVMVSKAMAAAEVLANKNISARVVNVSTIKPLDVDALRAYCKGVKGVVTAEEHSIYGGLGSAVCEALSTERIPVEIVGIHDDFGISAENYQILLERYHLTAKDIIQKATSVIMK